MSSQPVSLAPTFRVGGDIEIHRLGFGAMRITGKGVWGPPPDREAALRVLRRLPELGVDFIDTADSYGPEVSERLIAEALHPYPAGLVIATKGGMIRTGPYRWLPLGRPGYLRQCVEMSLRRLRLERIDLYQLHRIDPKVPAEETLGELKRMQEEGKIRHFGLSEVKPAEIDQARKTIAIVSIQNRYNLADRSHEDTLEYCEKNNLAFIPWDPMGAGELARPGGALDEAARKHGASVAQIAIAWLLHRSPVMLPIPGTSSVEHLEENVAAVDLKLEASEWSAIEQSALQAQK